MATLTGHVTTHCTVQLTALKLKVCDFLILIADKQTLRISECLNQNKIEYIF